MFLAFLIFAGVDFFLKWKGHFSFRGSARKDIRAVWRGFNSDSVLRKLFSGDLDFRKTETNLFLYFVRAEEGVWGRNPRGLLFENYLMPEVSFSTERKDRKIIPSEIP